MQRVITNIEFEEARTKYIDLINNIMYKYYASTLSPEQLAYAGDRALWRCLQYHNPKYKCKFSSSLYKFIHWECLRIIEEEKSHCHVQITTDIEDDNISHDTNIILNDYLSLLNPRYRRIVEARFLENRTLAEIAVIEGCSRQGIQYIVRRSLDTMSEAAHSA